MLPLRAIRKRAQAGFTLIEVLVAIVVLTVGVVAVAALSATMLNTSHRSKYMSLAASLASEKLEDLNRWDAQLPQVCVPSSSTAAGSLTSDINQTTTCSSGASDSIAYYDDVSVNFSAGGGDCPSVSGGCFAETLSSQSGSTISYVTTYHSPDGQIAIGAPTTTPPSNLTFHRRWLIEANTPVTGVRRITVRVATTDPTVQPPPVFQMSTVRP